jgi:CheY-like chemotaxis protein
MKTMKTVQVVEDDISILAVIRLIVEQNGHARFAATSARKTLEHFAGKAKLGSVRYD